MRTSYRLAPRYTPGSPATLWEGYPDVVALADEVAASERRVYGRVLEGVYGEQRRAEALQLGISGIVTKIRENARDRTEEDLLTGDRRAYRRLRGGWSPVRIPR